MHLTNRNAVPVCSGPFWTMISRKNKIVNQPREIECLAWNMVGTGSIRIRRVSRVGILKNSSLTISMEQLCSIEILSYSTVIEGNIKKSLLYCMYIRKWKDQNWFWLPTTDDTISRHILILPTSVHSSSHWIHNVLIMDHLHQTQQKDRFYLSGTRNYQPLSIP